MTQVTQLTIDNAHARATLSLYGGQVLSFVPKHDGRERLFVSSKALLDGSKSIRGGIPVCWPWFGAWRGQTAASTPLPAHGYARNRHWQLLSLTDTADGTTLMLALADCKGPGFGHAARLLAEIRVGRTLSITLHTTNTGPAPFPLGVALHSYFAVSDIAAIELHGLHGDYSDKTRDWAILPTPVPYRCSEETDRIHLDAAGEVQLRDGENVTRVQSQGHDSIVVWNPWENGSKAFGDLLPDDYRRFICVETALTQGFMLPPGATHVLGQTLA